MTDAEPRMVVEQERRSQPLVAHVHLAEIRLPERIPTGSRESNGLRCPTGHALVCSSA